MKKMEYDFFLNGIIIIWDHDRQRFNYLQQRLQTLTWH